MDVRQDAAALIRAGRLVEAGWLMHRQYFGDPSGQCDEPMRAAFFAGAHFLFAHIVERARINDDGTTLYLIKREFEQYDAITQLMNVPPAGTA